MKELNFKKKENQREKVLMNIDKSVVIGGREGSKWKKRKVKGV